MATGLFNLKQVNQAISQGAWSGYIAPRWVEYLVVAGGGSGGAGSTLNCGGGGAGGLLTGIVSVTTGTSYTVTVGAGGGASSSGASSVFGSISTTGGGRAGSGGTIADSGVSGGSGGGGNSGGSVGGQGTSNQGNAGGTGFGSANGTGGGGGAGTVGLNGTSSISGNGGAGIASAISGTVTTYAGGGGGAASSGTSLGAGGVGGGGAGGSYATGIAGAGSPNTGGGGGGYYGSATGIGGSGIVVVRYPGNVQFYTGGTVTYSNGYIVHNFTASGTLAPTTPALVADYQITRSLRFNSADSAYLARTPASASNQQIWTINTWVKRSKLGTLQTLLRVSGVPFVLIDFTADDKFSVDIYNGSVEYILKTTQVFRDVSAWGMMTIAVDTTQATSSDRVKIYWNGVQITSFVTSDYPPQNNNTALNSAVATYIGGNVPSSNQFTDFYLTEFNLIDGQALTPTSFGYVNPTTGIWSPAKFIGAYGTNGFYLNFSDNSNTTAATLGKDYSGNGNNWTPNNFSVTAGAGNDSLVDSPTSYGVDTGAGGTVRGNYCTWNAVGSSSYATLSNGNLDASGNTAADNGCAICTIGNSSGKWYWEETIGTVVTNYPRVGAMLAPATNGIYPGRTTGAGYLANGVIEKAGSTVTTVASFTTGDVIGMALDLDNLTLAFYKNNSLQYTVTALTAGTYFSGVGEYNGSTSSVNFGQRPFAYTAPSGFKALCTQNLPTPTIGATSTTLANKYFDVVLRNGGGSSGGTYSTTVNMANGAWLWDKPRNQASDNYLVDSVRGLSKFVSSNQTSAEVTIANWFTGFNNGSFTTGSNDWGTGVTIVDWIWAAGGSGSTNTAGTITSTVSANTTSGFSIVTWTGTGANATVGHGLGVAPAMYINKKRNNTSDWGVYHQSLGATNVLQLQATDAALSIPSWWNSTAPTSSVFSVGTSTNMNGSGNTYVTYCFAEVAGYSKFGSYTGNGSADGAFVYTGFRPAYLLIKRTSSVGDWFIWDAKRNTFNALNSILYPNLSNAEATGASVDIDFVSNGFKLRASTSEINSGTFIFAAFAEFPFKYSLAR